MANSRCVICRSQFVYPLTCHWCGNTFFCSMPCAILINHPCRQLRGLCEDWQQLEPAEKNLLSVLYTQSPSQQLLEKLIRQQVSGPVWPCLWAYAVEFDLWPHLSLLRQTFVRQMSEVLAQNEMVKITLNPDWSRWPVLFLPLLEPMVKKFAPLIVRFFDYSQIWRFIFATDALFQFLTTLLTENAASDVASSTAKLLDQLRHLTVRRGRGFDLIVSGPFVHLPLDALSYEIASACARHLKLPSGLYFIHDRQRWEKNRQVFLLWQFRRQHVIQFIENSKRICPLRVEFFWQ